MNKDNIYTDTLAGRNLRSSEKVQSAPSLSSNQFAIDVSPCTLSQRDKN